MGATLVCLSATTLAAQPAPDPVSAYREQAFFSATDLQFVDRIGALPTDIRRLLSQVARGEALRDSVEGISENESRFRFASFNGELVGVLYETSSAVGRLSYFLIAYREDQIACRYYLRSLPTRSDLTDIRELFLGATSERPSCDRRPLDANR